MLTLDANLKIDSATSQYTNFDFNSFVNFNGVQLGAKADGIFELGGDDDNGTNIDAYFEPFLTDLGTIHQKRMRYLYLEMKTDGDIIVTISSDGGTAQEFTVSGKDLLPQKHRIPIPRTLRGTYWLYQVKNVNGADFSINSMSGIFIFRNHGLS